MTLVIPGQFSVLIVEDNRDLAFGLAMNFEVELFHTLSVHNGQDALNAISEAQPSALILDLILPDMSGLAVLRTLRERGYNMPVLVLSGLTSEMDKVLAFELGADDYITKPFSVLELIARTKVRLRGPTHLPPKEPGVTICINVGTHSVMISEKSVRLTPKEFGLLLALVQAQGRVLTSQQLLQLVWNVTIDLHTSTVQSHIKQLRAKLRPFGLAEAINTLARVGYTWSCPRHNVIVE